MQGKPPPECLKFVVKVTGWSKCLVWDIVTCYYSILQYTTVYREEERDYNLLITLLVYLGRMLPESFWSLDQGQSRPVPMLR